VHPGDPRRLGEDWLDRGWIYIQFRRPTYPNEQVKVDITQDDTGLHHLEATKDNGEVGLRAELGMGEASWTKDFALEEDGRRPEDRGP